MKKKLPATTHKKERLFFFPEWFSVLIIALLLTPLEHSKASELVEKTNHEFRLDGGEITGGPFEFCVGDGIPDKVSGVVLQGNSGPNSQWIVTDENGKILGLPPTPEAVDFDGAGPGVCLIWHLSFADGLSGLEPGNNTTTDLVGDFDLSNSIRVYRNQPEGGTIEGGPFHFTVGDGIEDNIWVTVRNEKGTQFKWVITDKEGTILGIPQDPEQVNFDGAGGGVCLVWHLSHTNDLTGLQVGNNALTDLEGCYDFSEPVRVYREEALNGGEISTNDDTNICLVDGEVRINVSVEGAVGENKRWVLTDDGGKIIQVEFNPYFTFTNEGVCRIYHISYDEVNGLQRGKYLQDVTGNFDLSNEIVVNRNDPDGGVIEGGPFEFVVGDGEPDNVWVTVRNEKGLNFQWVVTDEEGVILGLPENPEAVDFDGAGLGVCLIWHLSFADGLTGLEPGNNATTDLEGCFDFSDPIRVYRREAIEGGEIAGGPFEFCVGDGTPDNVSGITLEGNSGANSQWIVTDEQGNILGLPPMPSAVDFDGAGPGVCLIWHISFADGLTGLEAGNNATTDLVGDFDLSNSIRVYRNQPNGGILKGGPYTFTVGDGIPDNVSNITLEGNSGANSQWVVTDENGTILGLPPTPEAVDFDGAGPGVCLIWHLSFADGLTGLEPGNNATTDLKGCFDFSDPIRVYRREAIEGGEIAGGPFEFCVGDGTPDNVSGITLEGNSGPNSGWIVTDEQGNILGLPPMPSAVDFDGAGPGVCLIWHISFEDGLTGLEPGNNATTDLVGDFDLSNAIRVYRNQPNGGILKGGPYTFTVGDGIVDNVSNITLEGNSGANSQWVVTDENGTILGLPPTPEAVDFDGAGPGVCLIWHLSFADGLTGLEAGNNATTDLKGCFDFSDPVRVYRIEAIEGGEIAGGPFEFCVGDGTPDNVSGITLEGNSGPNSGWIVTDEQGNILGLPPMPSAVDFDGAGPGVCLIWHISFADGLTGLEPGNNATTDLVGDFDLSNSIRVYRNQPNGGILKGGPYTFTVGDGIADNVSSITLEGNSGANSQWVVTDENGNILGLPPTPEAVDFDGAGPGVCLIWHLSFADGLTGLEAGNNATTDLEGCYDLSNPVRVLRNESTSGSIQKVSLFPIPARDIINLDFKGTMTDELQFFVYDLSGNDLSARTSFVSQTNTLDVASLPSGIYLLRIIDEKGKSVSRKIVIQ
ncbi:T9SS type A sorting domain-containing protein [Flavobacteriaceae bacterium M23B6Z8]